MHLVDNNYPSSVVCVVAHAFPTFVCIRELIKQHTSFFPLYTEGGYNSKNALKQTVVSTIATAFIMETVYKNYYVVFYGVMLLGLFLSVRDLQKVAERR